MKPTPLRNAVWLLLCATLLSGCGLGLSRPAPVKHYYLLETTSPASEAPAQKFEPPAAHAFAVRITGFEVAPPFADRALVYRIDEQRYESDFYNEFFVAPRSMVTSRITEWLSGRKIFAAVLPSSSALESPYAMEGLVNAMYGDLRSSAEPSAVFTMQVFVTETRTSERPIVLERTYSHTVRVADRSAAGIAAGMSLAFQQCLADLETDLRKLALKP